MRPIGISPSTHIGRWTLGFVAALYVAWIGAWLLEEALAPHLDWIRTDAGQFTYWTAMKLAIWVIPALSLIRLSGRTIREVVALDRWRSALLWGGGVGLALGVLSVLSRAVSHQPLFAPQLSWAWVDAVIISPIVEEVTFRGAVLGGLMRRSRFAVANTLTALLFLGAHLPGWYFQGRLLALLTAPVGGALSIFLIGWVLGFVYYQSRSVLGSTLAHLLNNLLS
jgi:membrane protease YdiL (CAAX protease family)